VRSLVAEVPEAAAVGAAVGAAVAVAVAGAPFA